MFKIINQPSDFFELTELKDNLPKLLDLLDKKIQDENYVMEVQIQLKKIRKKEEGNMEILKSIFHL